MVFNMGIKSYSANQKKSAKPWGKVNPLESFKDIISDVGDSLTNDLLKGSADDIVKEGKALFGVKSQRKISGTLSPNETLDLNELRVEEEEIDFEEPKMVLEKPLFRPQPENFIFHQKERELEHEIEAILTEIKKEIKRFDEATRNLERETASIIVEEVPPNPGVYHINFYEWLLGLLKNIRKNVESAGAWLSAVQSKKIKKGYWARFKKQGTSFSLNSERTVATQTG